MGPIRAKAALFAAAILLVAAGRPGHADEPWSLAAWGLRGTVIYKNFAHFEDTASDDQNIRNEGILQLQWEHRFAPWSWIDIVGELRVDDANYARGVRFQIPDDSRFRSIVGLREAVAGFQLGPVELTAGKQFFDWGTAYAFNPTDNLNPYDYLDPIDREKMGVYSVAARLTRGPTVFTFVVVPVFTPSRTPLEDSRWVPEPPPGVVLTGRDLPDREFDDIQYAARVGTTIAGWDLSLSYFEGFEDTPALRRSLREVAPGVFVTQLTPVFTRMRVPGFDFATTHGKFAFHGEFAAKLVDSDGAEDRFQGIVGATYTWDELGLRWLEQINATLEYAREESLGTRDRRILRADDAVAVALLDQAFRNAVVGRVRVKFTEDTELRLTATADLGASLNHYAQAVVNHRFTNALHLEAGFDIFGGDRDTFWGRWKDNDRFFAFVKYFF